MRYALLLSTLFFFAGLGAQSSELPLPVKNQVTLGGSISGSSSNDDNSDESSSRFNISPYVLLQLDAHWQLGSCVSYGSSRSVSIFSRLIPTPNPFPGTIIFDDPGQIVTTRAENTSTQLGACVFGRYTFNPEQRLNFFLQPGVGSTWINTTFTSISSNILTSESTSRVVCLSTQAGLSYRFSPRWRATAFAGNLGYALNWNKSAFNDRYDLGSTDFFYNLNLSSIRFAVEFTL